MPIEKVSKAQYATQLQAGILDRNNALDVAYGPIPDSCVYPQAAVLEDQNTRTRQLSLLLALTNLGELTGFDTDIEAIVFNEGLIRIAGSASTATLTFARATAPTVDAVVARGFPVASQPDASTGGSVVFVASESRTMPAASASSYFNIQTQRYELSVPVISVTLGTAARVGANRINRPLRPLAGFDTITNTSAAVGGFDRETNTELVSRYFLSILGRQTGTATGIERVVRADYPDASDVFIVYGDNPLLTRAATDAGAVDAWIKGTTALQIVENHTYLGVGQLIPVALPPLISVVSVVSGATTYVAGTDYEVTFDSSGVSRSPRAADGVTFLTGGPSVLPAVGAVVTITYVYDNLMRALQSGFEQPDVLELGRDLLFREGIDVPIVLVANLKVLTGFNPSTISAAVSAALLAALEAYELGADVENSDIQAIVRAIDGVDNFIITRLTRATVLSGTSDIAIADNEYASLSSSNLTIGLL